MLYVFHGEDIKSATEKARKLVSSLRAKKPDAAYVEIDSDNWNPAVLESHLGGQGLFSNKYIVFLNRVCEKAEITESLSGFIPAMKESSNIFIMLESKLNADMTKLVDRYAEKTVESTMKTALKKNEFNVFDLAEAFGNKDAVKAWILYRKAMKLGIEAESIAGTLFWQTKSIWISKDASSAIKAGLSPFVFSKAKRMSEKYKKGEIEGVTRAIISVYHESHRGNMDFELGLEKIILNCGK